MIYIPNAQHPTWPAQSAEINKLLGLREKEKLPDAGMPVLHLPALQVDKDRNVVASRAVKVWVNPIVRKVNIRTSKHRVMCECPDCGMHLSVGRLAQHVCSTKE